MSRSPDIHPHRLSEHDTAAGSLLREAAELAPPPDVQARIWKRLAAAHPRLVDDPRVDAAIATLLREAADIEPPEGSRERIWRDLIEEREARTGIADPPRLLESIPILRLAAAFEPPFGRRTRLLHGLGSTPRRGWGWATVGFAAAMAALLLMLRPGAPAPSFSVIAGHDVRILHTRGSVPAHHLGVGDRVELPDADAARWQLATVGDIILDGQHSEVALTSADRHGVRLNLDHGHLAIHANKRARSAPLIIHSHDVDVEVVGTILAVDANPSGVQVFVREGLVKVDVPGQTPVYVGAGQHWPSTLPQTADWAENAMRTLAGEPEEAPAVASVAPLVELALPDEPMVVAKPIDHARSYAPKITVNDPVSEAAAAAEPTVVDLSGVLKAPAGARYDLENESSLHYGNRTANFIRTAVSRSEAIGDKDELAVAYLAEANAPDTTPEEQHTAALRLVTLLDDQLGATADAVAMRRELRSHFEGADRDSNRLTLLEDLVELGRSSDALNAARDCQRECSAPHRSLATILRGALLAQSGRTLEAREASHNLTREDFIRASAIFASRAYAFQRSGQQERARSAASLALAIDPQSAQAAQLQALLAGHSER